MRYDTPVFFCKAQGKTYNYETGDYDTGVVNEVMRHASVENTRADTLHFVYGEMKQDSITIHLQNHYEEPFDHIRIKDKRYKVDYTRRLRVKQAFIVSEVKRDA